jgi:D-alanyl-D-alanine carboxypeptidase
MKNRVGRIIVAILALAAFGFYAYRYEQTHWHSADVEAWGPATGLHPEGFEQGVVMNQEPEAPIQMQYAPAPTEQPAAPAPTEQPVVETVPTEQPLRFDLSEWQYMLVNGDHSIDQYEPENLVYLNMTADETDFQTSFNPNRIAVDARIAQPLMDMALACKAAGLPVYLSSGYRSYADQAANFTRVCQNNGITDGKDSNGHYITMPAGCSEHQTGLCCDITDYYQATKNSSLDDIPTLVWLRENCADYGFIWRFPSDKSDVTGVMGESWHFRYVGQDAAHYIMDNHLTLEEFWQQFGDSGSV